MGRNGQWGFRKGTQNEISKIDFSRQIQLTYKVKGRPFESQSGQ